MRGGCLRCGIGPTGIPDFAATEWSAGIATVEEPSCGNHFHPYGAVELGFVVDLIASVALEALLDPTVASQHAIWLGSSQSLTAAGGHWTSDVLSLVTPSGVGQRLSRGWPEGECPACGGAGAAQLAAE